MPNSKERRSSSEFRKRSPCFGERLIGSLDRVTQHSRLIAALLVGAVGAAESPSLIMASTVESLYTMPSGKLEVIGSVASPVQSSEVNTVLQTMSSEISRKATPTNQDYDPNNLGNTTYNGAMVMWVNDYQNYAGNNGGRTPEQDIATLNKTVRDDEATAGIIPPGTNTTTSSMGFQITHLILTADTVTRDAFGRWDQPQTFIDNFNQSGAQINPAPVNGFLIPSTVTDIRAMKDQAMRDILRVPPAHYSNATSSNFASDMSSLNLNPNLLTVQVHTDAYVQIGTNASNSVRINQGAVERGDVSLGISPNHESIIKERQRQSRTHIDTQNAFESYDQPYEIKNVTLNLKPTDASGNIKSFNPSLTKIREFTPQSGKSGKLMSINNIRSVASPSSPTGAELSSTISQTNVDGDPRNRLFLMTFDEGTANQSAGWLWAGGLSYGYRENIDQTTGNVPVSMDALIQTYTTNATVDSGYLTLRIQNVVNSTSAPTATPINTPTVTLTRTPSPSGTPTATPTPTETGTVTGTSTSTGTRTETATITATATDTSTPTETETPTVTKTRTVTHTPTSTITVTITTTTTTTAAVTETETITATPTPSGTVTRTETATVTQTATETFTVTPTPIWTFTPTPSRTPSATNQPTSGGGGGGGGGSGGGSFGGGAVIENTATVPASPTGIRTSSPTNTITVTASPTGTPITRLIRKAFLPFLDRTAPPLPPLEARRD